MTANTRLRLWKEARALLPFWAAMASSMVVPFLLQSHTPLHYSLCAYYFGCALLGAVVIGQEFQHRTMGLLLSQPVSRRRLWWEKMSVLGAALSGLLLCLMLLGFVAINNVGDLSSLDHGARINRSQELRLVHRYFLSYPEGLIGFAILLLPLLLGFGTGPLFTLLARGTMGGVTLTFLCPFTLMLFVYSPLPVESDDAPNVTILSIFFLTAFGFYPGVLFLLGCWRFQRWEDRHGHGQELALPASLAHAFARFTGRLTLNHGGALGHLVRKEVRLHLPAFVVAGIVVTLWVILVAVLFARPSVDRGFTVLPTFLLCLGIPVITGIVSTAEERSLGLHEWHLTLPVSARRQWFIKVFVALGVNMGLGILLPEVLGHGSAWIFNNEKLLDGIPGSIQPLLIANAVIFCAALYASTASANSMRALVGTIILFLVGAMVMNLALRIAEWPYEVYHSSHSHSWPGWLPRPEQAGSIYEILWPWGWFGFSVWFLALGLANFRRSLESIWRPTRRFVVFAVSVCIFLTVVFCWQMLRPHYYQDFYHPQSPPRPVMR